MAVNESLTTIAPLSETEGAITVAAVDLGSNSFHMLVAQAQGSDLKVIDRLRESVRLAAGLDADRRLSPEVQLRALACLQRFGQRLKHVPGAYVRAVGTNTMRKMKRGQDFHAAAEIALGHSIEIISGVEEARLVYGGVVHGRGDSKAQRLVVDIGGGSTELIIGRANEYRLLESVALGCVVHTQRFFEDGEITRARFREARLAARLELEFLEQRYRKAGWDVAIGASGTVRGIWRVMREQGWADEHITREGLEKVVQLTVGRGKVEKIDFPALRDDRRPVFVGGLAVLAGVFDSLGIERMETSERALREGLIYDLLGRLSNQDVREESVHSMASRFGVDGHHAEAVSHTARQLLAQVAKPWQLDPAFCAPMLRWAGQLHEIGLSIAHSSYNKHGEYILRHADLHGFSQSDQKLLAVLVRLHRGKFTLSAFDDLPTMWVVPIRRLAILFRLAALLHRGRTPDLDPPVSLTVKGKRLSLKFGQDWLEQHPLTKADLAQEATMLKAIDVQLSMR